MNTDDLDDKYLAFAKASMQTVVLLAQVFVVVGALLCSVWWHYVILAVICCMVTPLWSSLHIGNVDRWWAKQEKKDYPEEPPAGFRMQIIGQPFIVAENTDLQTDDLIRRFDSLEQGVQQNVVKNRRWPFTKD